jgi:hypothetical protein
MLCFLYLASIVQRGNLTAAEFEEVMPVDRRLLYNIPCLIENIIFEDKMKRQRAATKREKNKRKA